MGLRGLRQGSIRGSGIHVTTRFFLSSRRPFAIPWSSRKGGLCALYICVVVAVGLYAGRKMYSTHGPAVAGAAGRTFGPIIQYGPKSVHSATVVMLHGLGDTGNGCVEIARSWFVRLL